MNTTLLIERDLKHIWHPCSQMKDYENFKPLVVKRARGSYIELADGKKIIDAISSWWCKTLGHQHPRLKQALLAQVTQFEHVLLPNTTHEKIILLSEKLTGLTTSLNKVFYAGDGSCAVEVAMKMSLHARQITGELEKTQFLALENGYHGETVGALSVSDIGIYKKPYKNILTAVNFISSLPYVNGIHDPLWLDCETHWLDIEKKLNALAATTTAIIFEPIVQGAGGMKIYSQDFLKRLRHWANQNNVHLIADEIMTGIARTGKMLACQHAEIEPDFLCLAKNLTAGWMPFSAMLTTDKIYALFYADYATGKSFLHSHTYSGHALGASIAYEMLLLVDELDLCHVANRLGKMMLVAMQEIAQETGVLVNVRNIGAIVAADLIDCHPLERRGYQIYQKAVALGALLRPLGNTIYWLPPINTKLHTIEELKSITKQALLS